MTSENLGPLAGLRVVDFGWVWAGAVPGQLLAFLGAEVIKVEGRARLDSMRLGLPIVGTKPDPEQQPMFHNVNRGKLSLGLDLGNPLGREIALDLVANADVVIENFSPGVMERLGLDFGSLVRIRPDIIMLSLSGGGQTGAYQDFKSYAATIAAYSGLDWLCGYPGEGTLGIQQPYADPNASLYGTLGILAAVLDRSATGEGCHIDLSQLEAGVATVGEGFSALAKGMDLDQPIGNASGDPQAVIEDTFQCANNTWVAISLWTDSDVEAMRNLVGLTAHGESISDMIAGWCGQRTHIEAMEAMQSRGIDAGAVTSSQDRFSDDHFRQRGVYEETNHPVIGWEVVYRIPWLVSGRDPLEVCRAPLLGEHNRYVICEILGRSEAEYAALVGSGALE